MPTPEDTLTWLKDSFADRGKIAVTDIDGVLRGKYISYDKAVSILESGNLGFCNVVFGWDINDTLYDDPTDPGFADASARLVPESRRKIPWENDLPFLLADFRDDPGWVGRVCPRSLLARLVDRLAGLGLKARFGPEYEWFMYRETPTELAARKHREPRPLSPGMFGYSELRTGQRDELMKHLFDGLSRFGVDLEGLHTETGPGVFEAAIAHRPALEAADRAVLFKHGVKQIAYRHDLMASFMAKPSSDLPGCGGHFHQSVWDESGNAFYNREGSHGVGISKLLQHYLAGQLFLLPKLMPMLAPTVNSYKRYVAGSWAATHMNWGIDNRTTALRIVPGSEKSMRLETRLPGADANPYLAIAACLAAGLYGIENELTLNTEPVSGSAYESRPGTPLPAHLGEATEIMSAAPEVRELLGDTFVDHFVKARRHEWEGYLSVVTDWEVGRYFELG